MKRTSAISQCVLFILAAAFAIQAGGEIDPTFSASAYGDLSDQGSVHAIALQPDGKMLIGGRFTEVEGHSRSGLARLNADGSIDTTFVGPELLTNSPITGAPVGVTIYSIVVLPDGKILIGGDITWVGTDNRSGIRRLNSDGSVDPTFSIRSAFTVFDIEVQTDGKIVIGGLFSFAAGTNNIARLNADGTNDAGFTASIGAVRVKGIEIQPDGKIIAGGFDDTDPFDTPVVRRFNSDGSVDAGFTATTAGTGTIEAIELQADGEILIAGSYTALNAINQGRVSRLNADGTVDMTFNAAGEGAVGGTINDLAIRSDGKIIICGAFTSFNSAGYMRLARLNADGSLDTGFTNSGASLPAVFNEVELMADSRILAGLTSTATINALMRFTANGDVDDPPLVVTITRGGSVAEILQQPDGKILAAGTFRFAGGLERRSLARYNADGTIDPSFVPYFNNHSPLPILNAVALQPDGKILVGASNGVVLQRLNSDGSLDATFTSIFPSSSNVWDVLVQADGKILVAGTMTINGIPFTFTRLNSNGTRDMTFNPAQPGARVHKVMIQPDGKYLVGGIFSTISDIAARQRVARYNADGNLDNTFVPTGMNLVVAVLDMDLQSDGRVVVAGSGGARLNTNGTRDESFNFTTNSSVEAVKVQPNGSIMFGGGFSVFNGVAKNGIARVFSNGLIDPSFVTHSNSLVREIELQPDGKILIGGMFTRINGTPKTRIARLTNTATPGRTLFDYDGDFKADVSVFRPSENRWYVFKSSDSTVSQTVFAIAGDVPVPADYDGDLKTDIAIYRPSSGAWWYLASSNGAQINVNWGGEAGDIPRPSDFDGDGKTDFVFFRPTNNFWYRISNAGGIVSNVQFGLAGDKPVRGDFDGDGKGDVAIYRPSTGDWWYLASSNGAQLAVRWGISTDIPAPADFDGDGRTDFAVYRPSTGVWYVINSSNGSFLIGPFGTPEDKPVPADYDGDGKAELAVFRPSTGVWYQLRTNGGFFAMQFGVGTDTPTPNSFVP